MALGSTVRNTNVDFNQGAFAFYGLRQLGPAADVTFGMRVNTVQGELDFKSLGVAVGDTKTWVDPIAGLSLRTPTGRALQFAGVQRDRRVRRGLGLRLAGFPDVGHQLHRSISLDLGYRWLDIDYSKGEGNDRFTYDVLTQGPVVGFGFRF